MLFKQNIILCIIFKLANCSSVILKGGYMLRKWILFCLFVADIDHCVGVTCHNGGQCEDGLLSYQCLCPVHTSGHHCETGWQAIFNYALFRRK